MQLKMEKKSPQQPLSSEELECGPEKSLNKTEDLEQQSGELNDETKPTDNNSDDDELEEGEVDETLEDGVIDEAIEDVKPDERREPIRQQGAKEILTGIRKEATRLADLKLRLELHWVKGHGNVLGNERADALAGAARKAYASAGNLEAAPDRPQLCELRLGNTSREFRLNVDRKEIQRVLDLHSRENAYKGEPVNGNAKDQDRFNKTILTQHELRGDPESLTGTKSSATRAVAVPECQPSPPRERRGREDSEGALS